MDFRTSKTEERPMRAIYIGAAVCLLLGLSVWKLTFSNHKEDKKPVTDSNTVKVESKAEKPPLPQSYQTVVLDPGHGMANIIKGLWDPGITSGKIYESVVVLKQAKVIKKLLEEKGYKVYLTRADEKTVCDLKQRVPISEKLKPTILVSLHCNGFSSSKVYGQEVIYWNAKSEELAEAILGELVVHLKKNNQQARNRGILQKRLRVVRSTITSVIVEAGFLSNPKDKKMLISKDHIAEQGITNGIDKYLTALREKE